MTKRKESTVRAVRDRSLAHDNPLEPVPHAWKFFPIASGTLVRRAKNTPAQTESASQSVKSPIRGSVVLADRKFGISYKPAMSKCAGFIIAK